MNLPTPLPPRPMPDRTPARTEATRTDAEKATALALCDLYAGRCGAHDKGIAQAARVSGIPRKTLADWHAGRHVSADVAEIRHHKKGVLVSMMEEAVGQLIGGITLDKIAGAKLPEITTALGTLIDKALLLSGEATARSESKGLHLHGDARGISLRDRL